MPEYIVHVVMGIIASLITATGVLLVIKFFRGNKKDVGLIAAAIPRFYVSLMALLFITTHAFPSIYIHLGIIMIFGIDLFLNFVNYKTKKYDDVLEFEQRLRVLIETKDKFFLLFENAVTGFYVLDQHGRFEYVNPSFCNLLGYSRAELLTKTVYDLTDEAEFSLIAKSIEDKLTEKTGFTDNNFRVYSKNGEPITVRAISTKTENGHPTITGTVVSVVGGHNGLVS